MNKDLKYILKRVIIGVLVGVILFSLKSCNVKALTNTPIGQDVEFPTGNATFLSMNDNYRFSNVGFRYFHGSTLNPNLYFATPTTNNLVCGNYGCGINIDGLSVVKDSYYSITIFLMGSNSPFWHYSYSALTNKVGVSNGFSSINSDYFVAPTSGTTSTSRSCNSIYDNEYTGNCLFQWTIIFKSPRNGTSVQTWWSSNPRGADPQDNGLFVGYTFKYIGDSSLTPEQLQSALTTVTTNITNNDNQNTQNIINNQNNNTQQIINEQQNTTDAINDLNDTMKDSSTDSPNSGINAVKNGLASNGVITQLITLPVTLFQQILTSINGTCQTFNLGFLLGTELILPCIDVSSYLGVTLWGIIDVIISGYFVWVIARKMISAFEMFSAMKDGDVLDD